MNADGWASDRVPQPAKRELPFRLRLVDQIRQGQRTANALENTGAPSQQRLFDRTRRTTRPTNFAAWKLQLQHELDYGAHRRPHRGCKAAIAGDQDVVPDSDRHIGAEVAVAVGVLDDTPAKLDRPGAVRTLLAKTPVERTSSRVGQSRRGERHRAFHVVPRVGMPAL